MSQYDYGTIDPNAKSGTQLAVDLNNWRDALHSGHRGAARPLYAQAGMMWIRETSAEQWDLMFYDGDTDFVLRGVNPATNQLIGIPQSAVSGLSEIATTTAELEGKAADLEVRAGELETKAGELEGDYANLAGRTSVLESIGKPFTKEYVSDELSITAGGLLTLTHGLGVKPKLVTATLVCKTAEAGYSVNDEVCVPVGPVQTDTNLARNLSVIKGTTSLAVKIAANIFVVMNQTTGTVAGITAANWRLVLRAWA